MENLKKDEVAGKIDFLKENIDKQIGNFKYKRDGNRRSAFVLTISLAISSALVTVLIGLHGIDGSNKTYVLNIALLLSALVTIGSVFDSFYNPKDLWVKYTKTTNDLYEIKSSLDYLLTKGIENIDIAQIDELYDEYQNVLRITNEQWSKLRQSSKDNKP